MARTGFVETGELVIDNAFLIFVNNFAMEGSLVSYWRWVRNTARPIKTMSDLPSVE